MSAQPIDALPPSEIPFERPIRGRGPGLRPCDFCRARKTRCLIQGGPPCLRCQKRNRACTFESQVARNGSSHAGNQSAGNQSSVSEVVLQASQPSQHIPISPNHMSQHSNQEWMESFGLNDSISIGELNPLNGGIFGFNTDSGFLQVDDDLMHGIDAYDANIPISEWPLHPVTHQLDQDPISESLSEPRQTRPSTYIAKSETFSSLNNASEYSMNIIGLSSEFDTNLRARYVFEKNAFKGGLRSFCKTASDRSQNAMFLLTPRFVTEKMADPLISIPHEPLLSVFEPYKSDMMELCNRFVCRTYPVPIQFKIGVDDSGTLSSKALLAIIYSHAWTWRSHNSRLPWAPYAGSHTGQSLPDVNLLHRFAWQAIQREMYAPTYAIIHACLFFLERRQPRTNFCETPFDSCLLSSTVTMCFSLGLHRNHSSWDLISNETKTHRQLTWWLVYLQDRWISAVLGRSPNIRADDFDVPKPPLSGSILPAEQPSMVDISGLLTETRLAETHLDLLLLLTDILDVIITDFIMFKAAAKLNRDVENALLIASKIELKLDQWRINMLRCMDELGSIQGDPVHFGNLKIAYIYCRVLVFRTTLRITQNTPAFPDIYAQAVVFLDLVAKDLNTLSIVDFGLFWFSWSRAQFNALAEFIIFIYVSAPKEMKEEVRKKVDGHRQWLWIHSKYIKLTRVSLIRIDSLLSATDGNKLN